MSKIDLTDDLKDKLTEKLPYKGVLVDQLKCRRPFKYTYTTGPFCLPQTTHSLDWGLLNNDPSTQTVRVTVYKCISGAIKTIEPPGSLEFVLDYGEKTHNANKSNGGFAYEIQVECNSKLVFPYASAWPGGICDPIPGTVIKSAEFIRKLR